MHLHQEKVTGKKVTKGKILINAILYLEEVQKYDSN